MGGAEGGLAMLTTQPFHSTYPFGNSTNSSNGALVKTEDATENEFPAGLRVLVVDDDPICLVMLENLLRRCLYKVTTCGQATTALSMLRENKDRFDLVISDVCMPDMDGFMLLELVGLEMDLPVIMMSANGETSAVMKGITHGACDYLLKPVRIEELRNIWQHVVRKKRKDANENKHYGSADHERLKREADDGEQLSPPSDSCDGKLIKKRKEIKDDDDEENEQENDDPSTSKKPRVVWSVELHQQFVNAVNHLGIDKAVPKRILELMNVQGLTRENVASHLQKYRLYLKRISGVSNQQVGMHLAFGAIPDSSLSSLTKLDGLGDFRTLVTAGQLPSYTLASLQAGVLNRLNMPNNVGAGSSNSPGISLMSLQGINCGAIGRPQISPHTLTNQGGLLPGLSSNMNLEQISQTQHQFAHVGHFSTLTDDAVQMTVLQQQLEAANGLGSSSHAGGMIHGRPMNSGNNSFRLQLLQHEQQQFQQGPEDMPGGLLGQCLISSETSLDCANQLSGAGSLNGVLESGANAPSRGTGGGLIASVANGVNTSATNISRSFTRMPALDCKPLHLAASSSTQCSFSGPSCTGVSTASLPTGMKDLSDHKDSLLLRSSATKPAALGITDLEFKHGLCQNIRQSWQVGQVPSLILSPKLGQLTGGQNLDAGLGQSAIQSQVVHSQKMNFQAGPPVDEETVMPRATTQSNNEQFTSGSLLRFMEQPLPDSLRSMKIDGGLASEQFSSADELLNIFFKQHQEGTSFAEGDLISDGYSLQNMYMK